MENHSGIHPGMRSALSGIQRKCKNIIRGMAFSIMYPAGFLQCQELPCSGEGFIAPHLNELKINPNGESFGNPSRHALSPVRDPKKM
jgi:hypothetical protein